MVRNGWLGKDTTNSYVENLCRLRKAVMVAPKNTHFLELLLLAARSRGYRIHPTSATDYRPPTPQVHLFLKTIKQRFH